MSGSSNMVKSVESESRETIQCILLMGVIFQCPIVELYKTLHHYQNVHSFC